jgi:MFS transporter, DHA1 family, multidrug resistance protein
MTQLVRDSIFGQFLHFVSGEKLLPSEEQKDPSLWQTRVVDEKSRVRNREEGPTSLASSTESSKTTVVPDDDASEATSNSRANAEKGTDPHLVDWYGPLDPEVNWLIRGW